MRSDSEPREAIEDGERVSLQTMAGECIEGRHKECAGTAESCTCVCHEPGFREWCDNVRKLLRMTGRPMELHDVLRFRS